MFNIGDKVAYPMHGAGIIIAIEKKEILGEIREYFILQMPINNMQVMVPVGNMKEVGVRDILEKDEMDKVIKVLKENGEPDMPKNWNRRYRFNMEKIKSGNISEIAEVVRNLQTLDSEKSLSTGERKMLTNARQIIVSEMVLVYGKSVDEITQIIDEAIASSE